MSESQLYGEILKEYSRGDTRLFRINAGDIAWQGTVLERTHNRIVLSPYRAIKLAAPGISDLVGWTSVAGTAIFAAIEVKAGRGKLRPEQAAFIDLVLKHGGYAGVARSVEEAGLILKRGY